MDRLQEFASKVIKNVERVIVGKRDIIELLLVSLLCEGHVLIEDVPGVGKDHACPSHGYQPGWAI